MGRRRFRPSGAAAALAVGVTVVAGSIVLPTLYLLRVDAAALERWSQIGEAVSIVGVLFSGVAFLAIAGALLVQQRELTHQREELSLVQEQQRRSSEIALRQLHMDIIKMAINDRDLLSVWPESNRSSRQRKKDHYCNLVLNLQKVAYEAGTIELDELRGALRHLMESKDMHSFWQRSRAARAAVTTGDEGEDFFTTEVDRAYQTARRP